MYCQNCGAKLEEGAKFCTSCGAVVEGNKVQESQTFESSDNGTNTSQSNSNLNQGLASKTNTNQGAKQKAASAGGPSKGLIIGIIVGLAVIILGIIGFIILRNRPQKIAIADYFVTEFYGANGYGDIQFDFDDEKFRNDYKGKIKAKEKTGYLSDPEYLVDELGYSIASNSTLDYDPSENLSNGDKVTVNYSLDSELFEEYYNIELIDSSKDYTVEGLMEVEEVDPREYFEYEIQGISPNANLVINRIEDAPDYISEVRAIQDNTGNLKIGDKVTVTLEFDPTRMAEDYGVTLNPNEFEVDIEGIPSYVMNFEDLSESQQNELISEGEGLIKASTKSWTEADLSSVDFIGAVTINPNNTGYSYDSNLVYLLYELTSTENIPENDYKFDFNYLTYVRVPDLINKLDYIEYGDIESSSNSLYHRLDYDKAGYSSLKYEGYYFLNQLMDYILNNYSEENYDIKTYYTIKPEDYKLNTSGVAGDYFSDQESYMRLNENGEVELLQNGDDLYTGSWSNNGSDIEFKFIGGSGDGIFEGIITDTGKIRVPDLGWSGEVFTKSE